MQILNLNVETRAGKGTGPSRRTRVAGEIPGVIYGEGQEPVSIKLNARAFQFDVVNKGGQHAIVQVQVTDNPSLSGPALLKSVQHHPVKGHVIHTDFMRISLDKPVTTAVAIHYTGRAKGVGDGGVADVQLHEVQVECLPLNVPTHLDVDITELGLGASLHVRDIAAPEGVTVVSDPDRTIIAIHVPRSIVEAGSDGSAEPAVVGADAKAAKEADKAPAGKAGAKPAAAKPAAAAPAAKKK